ncbi:MAG: thioredoxin family protein [Pontiella sp.]
MKLQMITALAIASTALTASAGIGIGDSIVDADVKMKSTDGSMVSINDMKGEKGTLVIFTCNKCPFVVGWQDTMVELGNTYMNKGIGVVFVNSNDPAVKGDTLENMQQMAQKNGYKFQYVADETSGVAKNFGAKKTPDVFLFDADNNLVYQGAVGEGSKTPKAGGETWLKDALDAVIAGNDVENSQTKAVGCSIKFR